MVLCLTYQHTNGFLITIFIKTLYSKFEKSNAQIKCLAPSLYKEIYLYPLCVVCWYLKGASYIHVGIVGQGGNHYCSQRGLTSPTEAFSGNKPQKTLYEMPLLFVPDILRSETKNSLFSALSALSETKHHCQKC